MTVLMSIACINSFIDWLSFNNNHQTIDNRDHHSIMIMNVNNDEYKKRLRNNDEKVMIRLTEGYK